MTLSQQIKKTVEYARKNDMTEAAEFLETFLIKQAVIEITKGHKKCSHGNTESDRNTQCQPGM